jgi:hypothetical protein
MTDNANSTKVNVLSWLNEQFTPEEALYRLLILEWDIPPELIVAALGDEADRSAIEDTVNTEDELFITPTGQENEPTYYCEEHDFGTENPQSWAAHHTNADHRDEDGSNDESEGLAALFG